MHMQALTNPWILSWSWMYLMIEYPWLHLRYFMPNHSSVHWFLKEARRKMTFFFPGKLKMHILLSWTLFMFSLILHCNKCWYFEKSKLCRHLFFLKHHHVITWKYWSYTVVVMLLWTKHDIYVKYIQNF